jgi:predicted deacetylase
MASNGCCDLPGREFVAVIPRPAQYLLRFDDLCPTMDRLRWERCKALIVEFGIRPILAVVPDNRDRSLEVAPADPLFWDEMRAMQAAGATIGLHGYRHLCTSKGSGFLALKTSSEFAGIEVDIQLQWLNTGLKILRKQGLDPTVWVAPNHGFDNGTLRALRAAGIRMLSDGLGRIPFRREDILWIPQQLWGPVEKTAGIWTICIHSNSADLAEIERLGRFLRNHANQFTSVDRVAEEFGTQNRDFTDVLYACYSLSRIQLSRLRCRKGIWNALT